MNMFFVKISFSNMSYHILLVFSKWHLVSKKSIKTITKLLGRRNVFYGPIMYELHLVIEIFNDLVKTNHTI